MTAGALLIALLVVVFAHKDFAQNPSFAGTPITPPKLATDAILDDTNGTPQHIVEPGYATTFVFFGYTRCPDECPLALASLGRAYRDLSDAARARTRIVFVTVDPAHDTPQILARYAGHFDPHIVALTGTRTALAKVWSAYGVEVQPQGKDLIGHGDSIYAIDATGHIVLVYPPDATAADLTHDAKTLAS
jgi:protein SCO1/2